MHGNAIAGLFIGREYSKGKVREKGQKRGETRNRDSHVHLKSIP